MVNRKNPSKVMAKGSLFSIKPPHSEFANARNKFIQPQSGMGQSNDYNYNYFQKLQLQLQLQNSFFQK